MLSLTNLISPRFFLLLAFLTLACITSDSATCHVDDLAGLLAFKEGITSDPKGLLVSWKPETDCCKWERIYCASNNRVNKIDLGVNYFGEDPENYLSGTLSPSLSKLRYLVEITLSNHKFSGDNLFSILFRLPNLKKVYVGNNRFSGQIPPNVGNLNKLTALAIQGNLFSGPIPSSVSKLTKMDQLELSNNLLSGTIPIEFGQLKKLFQLNIDQNQITGNIPEMFSSMSGLGYLNLSHNKLSGKIPSTLSKIPKLVSLDLGHNALTGNIPSFLKNLNTLVLSSNKLSGTVPNSFANSTIQVLDLSHNLLEDPFPQMSNGIYSLDLSYNSFHLGDIPKWVTSGLGDRIIKLAKCGIKIKLDGWKPTGTRFFEFITTIDLSDNEITGSPVSFLKRASRLKEFSVSGNQLRFNMERLKFSSSLESLDLSRNHVYGKLPEAISGLQRLNVSYNHLCGLIPATNFSSTAFVGNDCLCGSPLSPCKM